MDQCSRCWHSRYIFSSYLRTFFDARFSKLSKRWRESSEKRTREYEDYVQSLIGKPHSQLIAFDNCNYLLIHGVLFFFVGVTALITSLIIRGTRGSLVFAIMLGATGIPETFIGMSTVLSARRLRSRIMEAIRREESAQTEDHSTKNSNGGA